MSMGLLRSEQLGLPRLILHMAAPPPCLNRRALDQSGHCSVGEDDVELAGGARRRRAGERPPVAALDPSEAALQRAFGMDQLGHAPSARKTLAGARERAVEKLGPEGAGVAGKLGAGAVEPLAKRA